VLPAAHRLRRSADFGAAVRGGRRSGSRTLVVHVARASAPGEPARVGFVVSKAVGGAVVRNRTKRRLRALARPLVSALPAGSRVVVRANPSAAAANGAELERDLTGALRRLGLTAGRTGQEPGVAGAGAEVDR
jgi:ribonuclease P protein component